MNKNLYNLEVGNRVIGVICPSKDYKKSMEDYFGILSSDKPADFTLTLNVTSGLKEYEIPNSLFVQKVKKKNGFTVNGDLIDLVFYPKKAKGIVKVKHILTKEPFTRVFEQIFYQGYYTANLFNPIESFLIHSSGVIADNKGFLFVGMSGKGKTTVANLSHRFNVLNDEINILEFNQNNDCYNLISTPFNGLYKNKVSGNAKLKAIFLLNHAAENKLIKISKMTAVKTLSKEIVPPIGYTEFISNETYRKMFDAGIKIIDKCDVYQLDFLPDESFWELIKKKYFNK